MKPSLIGCSWVFAIWESWPNIKKSKVSISLKKRLPKVYFWKMDLLKFPKGHFSLSPMYIIGNSLKRIKGPATAHVGPTSLLSMTMIHKKLIDWPTDTVDYRSFYPELKSPKCESIWMNAKCSWDQILTSKVAQKASKLPFVTVSWAWHSSGPTHFLLLKFHSTKNIALNVVEVLFINNDSEYLIIFSKNIHTLWNEITDEINLSIET